MNNSEFTSIEQEREKTAHARFYSYVVPKINDRWRYLVCDATLSQKTIGKFTTERDQGIFLDMRRLAYIESGK